MESAGQLLQADSVAPFVVWPLSDHRVRERRSDNARVQRPQVGLLLVAICGANGCALDAGMLRQCTVVI